VCVVHVSHDVWCYYSYMLSVGHLDIMCVLYMFHMMYGVIIHTCWNSLLAPQWMSSGAVFSKGKY
jgi:hypothetical protein